MKKKVILLLTLLLLSLRILFAQVGIGTATPNASAKLDISSTNSGVLMPRMTQAQRDLINSPATGLMIYQTDNTPGYYFYNGAAWTQMGTGSATNFWTQNGNNIYNNNTGYAGIGTATPDFKLTINQTVVEANTNTHVLRLKGQNPLLAFSDQNDNSYGYIKMWSYQPFAPYTNGMVIGANPGYPIFLSTNNYGATMTIADNGNVGVGTTLPDFKLTINESVIQGNTNTNVLKLKGQNPVLSFNDQNDNSYGYIKMWSYQPFAPYTNGMVIGANPGYPIFLSTNNYGATMTIADNGNVGINTTTPAAKLHIAQDNEALRITGSQSYLSFYNGASYKGYVWNSNDNIEIGTDLNNTNGEVSLKTKAVQGLTVQSDGRVRVGNLGCNIPMGGTIAPKFSVFGGLGFKDIYGDQNSEWSINFTHVTDPFINYDFLYFYYNGVFKAGVNYGDGSWNSVSDLRLKEDIRPYKSVLGEIKQLDVSTFYYKDDKTRTKSFGLVAQNLKQHFPELVSGNETNGYLAIAYGKTGVLAIKAIQEQQVIIETLEKKIEMLEKRLAALENKLR